MNRILDLLVFLFQVSGAILVIFKSYWGFVLFIVGCFLWLYMLRGSENIGQKATLIVFILIDVWGIIRWAG